MKKSILSLSAAVALGGLGFAGSASAIAVYTDDGAEATKLVLNAAGTGHMLFTPYFSAQGNMATLVNVVNTDTVNGKAVKVRFRSAANSDDLLDFTLFLSPGDVWSGAVVAGADGRAQLNTPDGSCTIPAVPKEGGDAVFSTERLPSYVGEPRLSELTREGYIEFLNMADVIPGSKLYDAIKHKDGVAPCNIDTTDLLSTEVVETKEDAQKYGLSNPTGGLMGSWSMFNQVKMGVFSGAQTAIVATKDDNANVNGFVAAAPARFAFFPQLGDNLPDNTIAESNTADPLLVGGIDEDKQELKPVVRPLWYDLPDMSTPMVKDVTAAQQADAISAALAKTNVVNEYVAGLSDGTSFNTDWVVSQPTRRYHTAVSYGTSANTAKIYYNADSSYYKGSQQLVADESTGGVPLACVNYAMGSFDREERTKTSAGSFSPGKTQPYCGEVFTVQFGDGESVLDAKVTARAFKQSDLAGQAGWAQLRNSSGDGLPIVGFSATQMQNGATKRYYNFTTPHRWIGGVEQPQPDGGGTGGGGTGGTGGGDTGGTGGGDTGGTGGGDTGGTGGGDTGGTGGGDTGGTGGGDTGGQP